MRMKRLPRYLLEQISNLTLMKRLLGPNDMTEAQARAEATDEVAKQAGKIDPAAYRQPTVSYYGYSEAEKRADAQAFIHDMLRDPTPSIAKRSPSTSSRSTSPVAGAPTVRRARRSKPSPPPVEPPVTKHSLPLLYTDGQRSGRGININHEFSDSPATQTWRQQNQRE
jgi:hypothetical protein